MFVHGQASQSAYSIQFSTFAGAAFWNLLPELRSQIRTRLVEIASVAGHLSSAAADEVSSSLWFEIGGHVVSYHLSDATRTLTVMSVVSFASPGQAANQ